MGSRSSVLSDTISPAWKRLGFGDVINDNAFFHLMLARIVEPASNLCKSGVNKVVWPEWDANTGNNPAEEATEIV